MNSTNPNAYYGSYSSQPQRDLPPTPLSINNNLVNVPQAPPTFEKKKDMSVEQGLKIKELQNEIKEVTLTYEERMKQWMVRRVFNTMQRSINDQFR